MTNFACRLVWLNLLLTICALTIAGQVERPRASEFGSNPQTIAEAQALMSAGKVDAAIEMLRPLLQSSPSDGAINNLLGLAYYQKTDYVRAIEHLLVAVRQPKEDNRQYREAVKIVGLSQYFLGHLKEALPYLEQVGNWSPDNVEIAYVVGLIYVQTHSPDKAREAFARMFKIQPDSAAAHLINAQMMIREQFEEFAEKELQKALTLDPKLPQANFLLGELAIFRADIDSGIELLQKEIAINPAFGMAYYRLGEAYTRQLKLDEAIAPLQKSIWLNPYFSGPYIVLGKVHLKKGDLANAEAILRRALKMDPNNFSGHYLLGEVLQRANRAEEAKKEFEQAERLRNNSDRDR